MSQNANKEPRTPAGEDDSSVRRGQTVQMNPAILGQAANMNPDSDMFKQLDAASNLLESATQPDGDGSDPSIEEYMAALIARSHGPSEQAETPPAALPGTGSTQAMLSPAKIPPASSAQPATPQPATPQPATPQTATPQTDTPQTDTPQANSSSALASVGAVEEISSPSGDVVKAEELGQQVSQPECRNAISELRELANISAQSSFSVHRGQQLVYQMHSKLTVALVALVVSIALTSLSPTTQSPAFFAAVIALTIALYWTVKYFHLGRQLHRLCFAAKEKAE